MTNHLVCCQFHFYLPDQSYNNRNLKAYTLFVVSHWMVTCGTWKTLRFRSRIVLYKARFTLRAEIARDLHGVQSGLFAHNKMVKAQTSPSWFSVKCNLTPNFTDASQQVNHIHLCYKIAQCESAARGRTSSRRREDSWEVTEHFTVPPIFTSRSNLTRRWIKKWTKTKPAFS